VSVLKGIQWSALVVALLVPSVPKVASGATFDLHLRPYCATADCGHASREAYEDFLCAAVEELNLEYVQAGISFRPTIAANAANAPAGGVPGFPADKNQYSELDVGEACNDDAGIDAQLAEAWRANVAAANPGEISYLLRQGRDWNCSRFPWKTTPYGIIGDAAMSRGTLASGALLAHEIGHYFGLLHTFTAQDPATEPTPVWDGDVGSSSEGLLYVNDTPDDPMERENCPRYCGGDPDEDRCNDDSDCIGSCLRVCNSGHDEDMNGNPVDGHVWNAANEITGGADPGSPHPDTCTLTWIERTDGQSIATFPAVTHAHNSMSYYPATCTGPTVVGGYTLEPFSDQQIDRMQDARLVYAVRDATALPDVCSGHGGDTDHDGICDDVDTCRFVPNLCDQETDTDGDDRPDGCDNCPGDANPDQEDLDGDGDGDACDTDDDDDGCFDQGGLSPEDQHPQSSTARIGTLLYSPYCTGENDKTWVGFEGGGVDTDGDGVPDCADYDDDDDGECDDDETLPDSAPGVPSGGCVGPDPCRLAAGASELECTEFVDCPKTVWWDVCGFGSSCIELLLKIVSVINPDPTTELVFDRIEIVNQKLYALAAKGLTASQSVKAIGALAGVETEQEAAAQTAGLARAAATAGETRVRLEIWRRRAGGEELVRAIGEFNAATLELGDVTRGRIVRLATRVDERTRAETLAIDTTYVIGLEDDEALPDRDRDGRPDLVDDCPLVSNADRRDDDGDGFGNRCDPDLDNDLEVTDADVERARKCEGADLGRRTALLCGTDENRPPLSELDVPDPVSVALASWCRAADLNGDGRVDPIDTSLVEQSRGMVLNAVAVDPVPEPPSAPGCVRPGDLEDAKLVLRGRDGRAGSRSLDVKGDAMLPYPFNPILDPMTRGLHVEVVTAAGRKVLDADLPPGAHARGAGWKSNAAGTRLRYASKSGVVGKASVKWGDRSEPGRVQVHLVANGDFSVNPVELPLTVELTLDAAAAATDHCAAATFQAPPDQPSCLPSSNGMVCR
jgi:hypothetical protein